MASDKSRSLCLDCAPATTAGVLGFVGASVAEAVDLTWFSFGE